MIISITGVPGSGKTTIAKLLAKKFGYKYYSIGDLRGRMAMDKGLTLAELNKIGETEDWTDKEADKYLEEIGKKEDNLVVDGYTAFYFIPKSLKILMIVDLKEGAKRTFKDKHEKNVRKDEKLTKTVEEEEKLIKERNDSNQKRYKKYYNVDFLDKKHYDFVIDTTGMKEEETLEKVLAFIKKFISK
jgi:predicted cytidylate kinase